MFDPTASAFVVPAVVIFIVGAIATWMPARRASRIDPLVILRSGE
jgi:ABC-type antimicrobial peptide transport system permease subunit